MTMKKLEKKNIRDILPLTPMQEGMLLHDLKNPDSHRYFEQLCLEVSGTIDINHFEQAWHLVIETNEMLRTVYRWENVEHPVQIVLKKTNFKPGYYDLSGEDDKNKQLEDIKDRQKKEKFDLTNACFHVTLCKLEQGKYTIIISNHHICCDGWSSGIILKEFFHAYNDLSRNRPVKPIVKTKFKEFVKWLQDQDKTRQKVFWKEYLQDFDPQKTNSIIPFKGQGKGEMGNFKIKLPENFINKVNSFVKEYKITSAALFNCTWGILLRKYTNNEDIIFGTTVSGRNAWIKEIENMVGLFINTLPIRMQVYSDKKIIDLLKDVQQSMQSREEYTHTSLAEIKNWSGIDFNRDFFDSIVVIENYPLDRVLTDKNNVLSVHSYSIFVQADFDLIVSISIHPTVDIIFSYTKSLFSDNTIEKIALHFKMIIRKILEKPGNKDLEIGDIEIITKKERETILFEFNHTEASFPGDKTVHQLFEEQVERTPDYIALKGVGMRFIASDSQNHTTHLSYRELDHKSNQLAYLLIGKGVQPDTIVGIMMENSIEMIVGLLGILKAGGAYLPIDPEYPEERINYMLADSSTNILVTSPILSKKNEKLSIVNCQLLIVNEIFPNRQRLNNPPKEANSISNYQLTINNLQLDQANLAYIIYTSGTTGRPKGVPLRHRGVVNTLFYRKEEYRLNWETTALQLFSYAFDGFVTSFFTPVISGAKVILLPGEKVKDIIFVKETIVKHRVTQFISVPSLYRALLENAGTRELAGLKLVTLAGDRVSPDIVNLTQQKSKTLEVSIEYGVTEAAVMSTVHRHQERHKQIKIGSPIWNTKIFIINHRHRMQPIGIPGEMCIAGLGIACGYLNNPELTCERFCLRRPGGRFLKKLPREASGLPRKNFLLEGTRGLAPLLYRTGDLARWLWDGNIEFSGRIDHQVKIRGFRIELGEIETILLRHKKIKDAVVISRADKKGDQYLCAFIIAAPKAQGAGREEKSLTVESEELRAFLAKELPPYMIPGYFIQLDKIPLNPNGKIDRDALPAVDPIPTAVYTAPRDAVEEKLVRIWAEVLGKDGIGIDDNFFQLGGHSLKAAILFSRVHKRLGIKIPLDKIFEMTTIRALSGFIKKLDEDKYQSIEPVEEKEYYPLSPAQKRLFILQQVETGYMNYNISEAFVLEGELDRDRFEQTLNKLINRHESLRTSFHMVNDKPVQKIHQYVDSEIEYDQSLVNCQGRGEVPSPIKVENITRNFIHPFDLSQAPLLMVGIAALPHTPAALRGHPRRGAYNSQEGKEHKHLLMVDMHHIITDGTSVGVLIKEFMALYEGRDLPGLRVRYKDYAAWQQRETQREKIKKQEAFWVKQFQDDIPVLDIPVDYPENGQGDFEGRVLSFEFDREITLSLKALADTEEVTLFMLLLALFNVLLWKISGTESIVVGTPAAGRGHADLEGIIGMFVHTLALRNEPREHKTFSDFLKEVKKNTLTAFENQDYPFENLVEKVKARRDKVRNPIFDVMFALQNMDISNITIPGLTITSCDYYSDIAMFDLYLFAQEKENRLTFKLGYASRLFRRETVESFFRYFQEIIDCVINKKDTRLKEIKISHQLEDPESNLILEAEGDFGF
jgi:amino acid adenylation domain-containing protein